MKNIVIEKRYTNALLEFINTEVINGNKDLEGVITNNDNFLNQENIYLYECFQALSKKYTIQDIENKISVWFPYGILISANDFSYEVVKKYTNYLSQKYNLIDKDLFFNPTGFFQTDIKNSNLEEIVDFFNHYKNNQNF